LQYQHMIISVDWLIAVLTTALPILDELFKLAVLNLAQDLVTSVVFESIRPPDATIYLEPPSSSRNEQFFYDYDALAVALDTIDGFGVEDHPLFTFVAGLVHNWTPAQTPISNLGLPLLALYFLLFFLQITLPAIWIKLAPFFASSSSRISGPPAEGDLPDLQQIMETTTPRTLMELAFGDDDGSLPLSTFIVRGVEPQMGSLSCDGQSDASGSRIAAAEDGKTSAMTSADYALSDNADVSQIPSTKSYSLAEHTASAIANPEGTTLCNFTKPTGLSQSDLGVSFVSRDTISPLVVTVGKCVDFAVPGPATTLGPEISFVPSGSSDELESLAAISPESANSHTAIPGIDSSGETINFGYLISPAVEIVDISQDPASPLSVAELFSDISADLSSASLHGGSGISCHLVAADIGVGPLLLPAVHPEEPADNATPGMPQEPGEHLRNATVVCLNLHIDDLTQSQDEPIISTSAVDLTARNADDAVEELLLTSAPTEEQLPDYMPSSWSLATPNSDLSELLNEPVTAKDWTTIKCLLGMQDDQANKSELKQMTFVQDCLPPSYFPESSSRTSSNLSCSPVSKDPYTLPSLPRPSYSSFNAHCRSQSVPMYSVRVLHYSGHEHMSKVPAEKIRQDIFKSEYCPAPASQLNARFPLSDDDLQKRFSSTMARMGIIQYNSDFHRLLPQAEVNRVIEEEANALKLAARPRLRRRHSIAVVPGNSYGMTKAEFFNGCVCILLLVTRVYHKH
jgi:hypothetical protein